MQSAILLLAAAGAASAQLATVSEPAISAINAAAATAVPSSPVSNVQGLAFKNFYQVWLENIDYVYASDDSNQHYLASYVITLNYFCAVAHPSEPNYASTAAGDQFAMDNDNFIQIPANVSTIVDLLDTKGISWGEYQESLPYAGFQGFNYSNQQTYANDYVRKHNPLILFDNVAGNASRASQIKNFSSLWSDVENNTLPQYSFITPNMTNDGHDTNISFSGTWTLLSCSPSMKVAHYSVIASLSANWELPSLGRWDCGANLLSLVADKVKYVNYDVDMTNANLNTSYPGPLSTNKYSSAWPIPLTDGAQCSGANTVLHTVQQTYHGLKPTYNYTSPIPYDTVSGTSVGIKYSRKG
ncbi:hypothetical protein F66182_11236, partial [Fusarium sp. NRRL 66182]